MADGDNNLEQQMADINGQLQEPAQSQTPIPIKPGPEKQPITPPRQGGKPLLLDYIQNMVKGQQQVPQGAGQPSTPGASRGDMTLNFMGQFLGNLAEGLRQSGHGPGAK